jgi:glucose/arabinose dehydrogenase
MCVGDCNSDASVSIGEIIQCVNIDLGSAPLASCPTCSSDGRTVAISDLVKAVNAALSNCAADATSTATIPAGSQSPTGTNTPTSTAATPTSTAAHFCDLPGSYQSTMPGVSVVPGAAARMPDLSFLKLPVGFCAHYYGNVGDARQLRFAPGGELFVSSPTQATTGGNASAGRAAIFVLPDDDHDGTADSNILFLDGLPMTQGLLFANGSLYYQDGTKIMRLAYAAGDRKPSGDSEPVADINISTAGYSSITHWPKALDIADDGTIYVSNGGDQGEHTGSPPPSCSLSSAARPFHGGILKLDPAAPGGASQVAKGFRNPISLRCAHGRGQCFAVELALDYSYGMGGREKLVPIRQGDDWGYPCCATQNLAYSDYTNPRPDCSGVASEIGSFYIGHTPFDVDFENGKEDDTWAAWNNSAFVVLHGEYGDWTGSGIIAVDYDAMTGNFLYGADLAGIGILTGSFHQFASGWGPPPNGHGRPANLAFAPDGRLFVGNDVTGDIFWIAPLALQSQP